MFLLETTVDYDDQAVAILGALLEGLRLIKIVVLVLCTETTALKGGKRTDWHPQNDICGCST
jgi:hypothetical protein